MIFRGRTQHVTVWRRFRSGQDGFTFEEAPEGHFEAHVATNAERAVDLMYVLTEHLPPAVDVSLSNRRTGEAWGGTDIALPDVRDVIARLKIPLATYAGVDISIFTPDDQLSLTAQLDLYAYGHSDRWLYLLQARGLEQYRAVAEKAWRGQPWDRAPAPVLSAALAAAAERLSLSAIA
ncbi:MAG: hypothetical protein M3Z05_23010 [Gemmatimonadota bacterium]|nr:hypothetical protein [Gemmatimonadota bacterium]